MSAKRNLSNAWFVKADADLQAAELVLKPMPFSTKSLLHRQVVAPKC
jgi:hypothetical protein